jgi:hypothetical protein
MALHDDVNQTTQHFMKMSKQTYLDVIVRSESCAVKEGLVSKFKAQLHVSEY